MLLCFNDLVKHIVILGAGFGGLKTALLLSRGLKRLGLSDTYRVILVDRNNYHTYTPVLYEIATTSEEAAHYKDLKGIATFPLSSILKHTDVEIITDEVVKMNLIHGDVHLKNHELAFEYLVIALGAETNYFNRLSW